MTATAGAPRVARRMTSVTWYRYRGTVASIVGIFAVAAAILLVEGLLMRRTLNASGLSRCLVVNPGGSACGTELAWGGFLNRPYYTADLTQVLDLVPVLVAVFAGVPWLTREFETGSFRYTWVQGVSRRQWLLGTFGPLVAVATVAAVACGLVFGWWFALAQWSTSDYPAAGWSWVPFGLAPQTMAGWTVFAMALALPIAILVRRTVPAMACCAVGFAGCFALVNWPLRDWMLGLAPAVTPGQYELMTGIHWDDLYLRHWLTGPGGSPASTHVLTMLSSMTGAQADRWLAQHHYTYWIAYQPHDRLRLFQFAVAALLVILAAAMTLASARLLSRRAGD